jgi:hypothetical protein
MSQYFKLANPDAQEVFCPHGGLALTGTLTGGERSALKYLLLDGPADGSALDRYIPLDALPEAAVEAKKEVLRERQASRGESLSKSTYYNAEADAWNKEKLATIIAASLPIAELYNYAGRWAGDRIHCVGDYADSGLYDKEKVHAVVELPSGVTKTLENVGTLRQAEKRHASGGKTRLRETRKDATAGDPIIVPRQRTERDYPAKATLVEYIESDWIDITDEVYAEMEAIFEDKEYPYASHEEVISNNPTRSDTSTTSTPA